MKKFFTYLMLVLIVTSFSACTKVDLPSGTPKCIKKLIKKEIKGYEGCLTQVEKMQTNVGVVYFFYYSNCLVDKLVFYDENCNQLCYTDKYPYSCVGQTEIIKESTEIIWSWEDN